MPVGAQLVRSRRDFLGAAAGAAAVGLVGVIARPAAVLAVSDDGATIHVGDDLENITSTTTLTNRNEGQTLLWCETEPQVELPSTSTAAAIVGVSSASEGVGVRGHASTGTGIQGSSTKGNGVEGTALGTGFGVRAVGDGNAGVYATSENGIGVDAEGGTTGVYGFSRHHIGVHGLSINGRGGLFTGGPAQIRLEPSPNKTHPQKGLAGDLFVDSHNRLWFCKGGLSWHQLA